MTNLTSIREHMEVIGADGVHVGIVDRVEGGRIKLTNAEAPAAAMRGTITMCPALPFERSSHGLLP